MEPTKIEREKKSRSRDRLYIVILLLLLLGYVPMIWQLAEKGSSVQALAKDNARIDLEASNMRLELENLGVNFQLLETDNVALKADISAQQLHIDSLKMELASAAGDKQQLQRIIQKLKKETGTLRNIMQGYVATIDSLGRSNSHLRYELGNTRNRLASAEDENKDLADKNENLSEQVAIGSVLETENMWSGAIRIRSGGGQKETNRAKNAGMVKTCFDVRESRLAKTGEKAYYVRIIRPDGSVLTNAARNSRFEWSSGSGFYTVKHTEKYNRKRMNVCIYFEVEGELPVGQYLTEVYCDKYVIGKAYFELK